MDDSDGIKMVSDKFYRVENVDIKNHIGINAQIIIIITQIEYE